MNGTLIRGVCVGGLAGLLFGFDTAVIAGTTEALTAHFALNPTWLGITVSSALFGTLAGAMLAGAPGDRFGSRDCLRAIAVMYLVSAIGSALAPTLSILIAARVVAGFAIGASSVLAPTYLAEIAPARWRGALVGAFQLNIVVGILIAYLSNYVVGTLALGPDTWRWKFAVATAPSLLLFVLLYAIPNSPRWLAAKGRLNAAREVLERIGATGADADLARISGKASDAAEGRASLSWSVHRTPILLAFGIAAFNQLSGINAILYYLNDIFKAAGFDSVSADLQSVIIGFTNLAFTLLALTIIDRAGRKTLLLIGSVVLVVALSGTAYIQLTASHAELLLWMLMLFIGAFAFSQGAVIWVYIAEVFPTEVRSRGQSLGASTHWLFDAVIAFAFPTLAAYSKGLPFVFFAVMMAIQFFVVLRFFPETKRVTLEQMETSLAAA